MKTPSRRLADPVIIAPLLSAKQRTQNARVAGILRRKREREQMSDLLDWAEKAGLENLKFRLQNSETLAKESTTTLTILLAGIAGSLTYATKYWEMGKSSMPLAGGCAALSLWLMVLSFLLVNNCIKTKPLQPPTNEPRNLYQPEFELEALRKVELKNLQASIDLTAGRNTSVAAWLDRVRYLAVASPVVFTVASVGCFLLVPGAQVAAWG